LDEPIDSDSRAEAKDRGRNRHWPGSRVFPAHPAIPSPANPKGGRNRGRDLGQERSSPAHLGMDRPMAGSAVDGSSSIRADLGERESRGGETTPENAQPSFGSENPFRPISGKASTDTRIAVKFGLTGKRASRCEQNTLRALYCQAAYTPIGWWLVVPSGVNS